MKAITKLVFLNDQNEKFFGEGPYRLLRMVEKTGSLHSAAQEMDMAYTKAMKLLKNAERNLGFALTMRAIGGKNGGGSRLTAEGQAWLERYEDYRADCIRENQRLYRLHFPQLGCVIMASGLGKRFGGNKLTANFGGEPMICRALKATDGLFARRVVVTRHADVAAICRTNGVETILHDLPQRSDTVRLGLEAVAGVDACMFCPGDQPLLRWETVAALLRSWERERDFIWRVSCKGISGSPVLFPHWAFEELEQLPAGKGGGYVLERHSQMLRCMDVSDEYELMDADTREEMDILRRRDEEIKNNL